MVINSQLQFWRFISLTTILALLLAEVLNVIIFPVDILPITMAGTAMIVPIITIPICYWIGLKMRENEVLRSELQRLVHRDRLTDVATRDFFFEQMTAQPDAYGVSLMIDIDYFKKINDRHGHFAGDVAIQTVAQILKDQTCPDDIVCRFGGEEFMVFLTDQSALVGYEMADTLRKAIAARLIVFEDVNFRLTVSIGGSMKERVADINVAIKQADDALYQAKRLGRNRTVFSNADDAKEGVQQSA